MRTEKKYKSKWGIIFALLHSDLEHKLVSSLSLAVVVSFGFKSLIHIRLKTSLMNREQTLLRQIMIFR
jgi:hypothetical protein